MGIAHRIRGHVWDVGEAIRGRRGNFTRSVNVNLTRRLDADYLYTARLLDEMPTLPPGPRPDSQYHADSCARSLLLWLSPWPQTRIRCAMFEDGPRPQ